MDTGTPGSDAGDMTAPDLASLISQYKGKRSYERLALDCGGVVSAARLQQMTKRISRYSEPEVIQGLARGLHVTVTDVVSAMSRSLGLEVHYGGDATSLVLRDAGALPDGAREAITAVATELLAAYRVHEQRAGEGHDRPAAKSEADLVVRAPDGTTTVAEVKRLRASESAGTERVITAADQAPSARADRDSDSPTATRGDRVSATDDPVGQAGGRPVEDPLWSEYNATRKRSHARTEEQG